MTTTVFGAKRNDKGEVILYQDGMNFNPGSFARMDWYEIKTGRLRSVSGKLKKAQEVIRRIESENE